MLAVGVDIGGTKIRAAAVDESGEIAYIRQVPTMAKQGPDIVVGHCVEIIQQILREISPHHVLGIGIASAGQIDPETGTVLRSTDTFAHWQGVKIADRVAALVGLPTRVENDVNAALLGEFWLGKAKGCDRAALVALGTGVGGALLENGQLAHGVHCRAGEFGHMIYQADGRLCGCGARGCYESYLSGPSLASAYSSSNASNLTAEEVMMESKEGNVNAQVAVIAWAKSLACLLVSIQNSFDPECIILGGGIVDSRNAWWPKLKDALKEYPWPVSVEPATFGNYAALLGAARLIVEGEG